MAKKLTCPYCRKKVPVPNQGDLVYWCHKNGGTCPQTGYIMTLVEAGINMPEQTALMILYQELSGFAWSELAKGNPDAPHCEYTRRGFLSAEMVFSKEVPKGSLVIWGVDFMRLMESEVVFDEVSV